jgi:hypothetical protein
MERVTSTPRSRKKAAAVSGQKVAWRARILEDRRRTPEVIERLHTTYSFYVPLLSMQAHRLQFQNFG